MFKALQEIIERPTQLSQEAISGLRSRRQALIDATRYGNARNNILLSNARMNDTVSDFSDLRRLGRVMKVHGINRAMLAFISPARKIITKLPGLESIDAITASPTDPRTVDAIDGVDTLVDTQTNTIADWVRTGANNLDSLLSAAEQHIQGFGDAISHYISVIEDVGDDGSGLLDETTLTAIPFDNTLNTIEALLDVFPELDAVVSDPTDRDATDAHREKLAGYASKLGPHTGVTLDMTNPHHLNVGDVPGSLRPTTDTFSSLGYTIENVILLLKKADNLVDEIKGLIDRKDKLVGQLNDASTMVGNVDNDVPPAVDGAMLSEYSEESFGTDSDWTQADIIHGHASSHLCNISSALDTAIMSVQNVLTVADHTHTNLCSR